MRETAMSLNYKSTEKKSVPRDTVIRSTTWHATSYVKKIMQSSGANLMECFTTNLPSVGERKGIPISLP